MMIKVTHWSHAVDPVPGWKDANATKERKRMRVKVTRWRISADIFYVLCVMKSFVNAREQ